MGWYPSVEEKKQVVRTRALVLQWSCVTNCKIIYDPESMRRDGGNSGIVD